MPCGDQCPQLFAQLLIYGLTDGAVVGVWPAGTAMKTVTETRGARTVNVPGVTLDYAFALKIADKAEA